MANARQFQETMARYLRARIPLIAIRTVERSRAVELLRGVAEQTGLPVLIHTLSQGTRDLANGRTVSEDRTVAGAMDGAGQLMGSRQNATFVFTQLSGLADDNPMNRQLVDLVLLASERSGAVLVIANEGLWAPLQRLGMVLTLDPPDEDEMLQVLYDNIEPYRSTIPVEWDAGDFQAAASILAGLTRMEAENLIASLLAGRAVRKSDMAELARAKDCLFSNISGLERIKFNQDSVGVGGLEGLRCWLERERPLLLADLRDRQMRPPRGVLLVGVPGCGKSLSAKFIAATWKMPLYRLDLANIHGMYLGQSESRLKEALATADRVAPCILWIDEIEKGLAGAGSSGDGGAATRLVGHFLFWLQEAQERVFVVATANNVASLPPELLRRGRFDELFFVDLPTPPERSDIITLYVQRYLRAKLPEPLLTTLIELSDGFAGADLEAAVREVAKTAVLKGDQAVTAQTFLISFRNIVPLSKTSPEQIDAIRAWGRERAVPASGQQVESGPVGPARRAVIV